MTSLLLPLLAKSPSARVVTMSSQSYRQAGDPVLDDIELERSYSPREVVRLRASGRPYSVVKRKDIPERYVSEEGQRVIWDFCREACAEYLAE